MLLSPTTTLSVLAALAVVLGLALLAARAVRATGWARPLANKRLTLQEGLALDRTRRIQIVRCDGRDLMLLTGGGTDVVVGWLPAPGEACP